MTKQSSVVPLALAAAAACGSYMYMNTKSEDKKVFVEKMRGFWMDDSAARSMVQKVKGLLVMDDTVPDAEEVSASSETSVSSSSSSVSSSDEDVCVASSRWANNASRDVTLKEVDVVEKSHEGSKLEQMNEGEPTTVLASVEKGDRAVTHPLSVWVTLAMASLLVIMDASNDFLVAAWEEAEAADNFALELPL